MRALVLALLAAALSACTSAPPPDAAPRPTPAAGQLVEIEDVDGNSLGQVVRWTQRGGSWVMRLIVPLSSCGRICNSNVECNTDLIKSCPFCNFGTCKSTRPEAQIIDAGVDAP